MSDKIKEALEASIAAFKAAYEDIITADKIINSKHSDRMQMEVTRKRLAILIDMNEEALAALQAEAGKWMPIETAPKEGQKIVVYSKPNDCISLWTTGQNQDFYLAGCSHWMPLPTPPQDAASTEGPLDINKCPNCGGEADNGHDRCVPPSPYRCTKCEASTEGEKDE